MADGKDGPSTVQNAAAGPKTKAAPSAAPKGNPVFRMMGLPNFRLKLPSRNWMIFLTIVGSWSGAVYYDRREKKRIQKKWCDVVSHLAREPLPPNIQPRKLTIFLSSPPADVLLNARDHFHEYVRPILSSAGVDWDAVEGRKEGDVRAELAERIRKRRKLRGEPSTEPVSEDDLDLMVSGLREKLGGRDWDGVGGDVVIGRNTWKEYVRGLHEGWLGPLDPPPTTKEESPETKSSAPDHQERQPADRPHELATIPNYAAEKLMQRLPHTGDQTHGGSILDDLSESSGNVGSKVDANTTADDGSSTSGMRIEPTEEQVTGEKPKEDVKDESKGKKPKQPPPFLPISAYSSASIPPSMPTEFPPTTTINFPHLLGFLNTPIRMYRYLNRRYVADEIGREVAAACFAAYRPFEHSSGRPGSPFLSDHVVPSAEFSPEESAAEHVSKESWEQQRLLEHEEAEWHKSTKKNRVPEKESVWLDDMVIDPRIGGRMRRFVLDQTDVKEGQSMTEAFARSGQE